MNAIESSMTKQQHNSGEKKPGVKLSRALSWALRHQGPQIRLSMTPDGYVPVAQILASNHPRLRGSWTLEDIEELVKSSDKQRFKLDWRPAKNYPKFTAPKAEAEKDELYSKADDTLLCICATQGHSLKFIDPNLLLTPIPEDELAALPIIVHGTYQDPWQKFIQHQGLKQMSRNHIHFAPGLPHKKGEVISGMRKTCDVYIYLDAEKCAKNPAITFYRSDNGVLLTSGVDDSGLLPVEYFSHVTDPDGNTLLDQRKKNREDS